VGATAGQHNARPPSIYFDAALPSRKHRARALGLAAASAMPVTAVWVDVPIEVAIARNAGRPEQERVPEHIIQHVFDQLEPPSIIEGFTQIIKVTDTNDGG
jgi:predicted kinase